MADILKYWNGSEWIAVTDVDRSVIERIVELVGHGIVTMYDDIRFDIYPASFSGILSDI